VDVTIFWPAEGLLEILQFNDTRPRNGRGSLPAWGSGLTRRFDLREPQKYEAAQKAALETIEAENAYLELH
jgi:hypothetical protein